MLAVCEPELLGMIPTCSITAQVPVGSCTVQLLAYWLEWVFNLWGVSSGIHWERDCVRCDSVVEGVTENIQVQPSRWRNWEIPSLNTLRLMCVRACVCLRVEIHGNEIVDGTQQHAFAHH